MSIVIARRFRGPEHSGNGGYSAGLFAHALPKSRDDAEAAVEVTLRKPPPLELPLTVVPQAATDGGGRLLHGETLIAEARAVPLALDVPVAPSFAEATLWSSHYIAHREHSFPQCFVCGTARAPGDGLRIFAGRLGPAGPVAAAFSPDASLGDRAGIVRPEMIWAALDCPGYFGVWQPGTPDALLGRMTARLLSPVAVGEPCVVVGWSLGGEGRKLLAGTALYGRDGRLCAQSQQVWITI